MVTDVLSMPSRAWRVLLLSLAVLSACGRTLPVEAGADDACAPTRGLDSLRVVAAPDTARGPATVLPRPSPPCVVIHRPGTAR